MEKLYCYFNDSTGEIVGIEPKANFILVRLRRFYPATLERSVWELNYEQGKQLFLFPQIKNEYFVKKVSFPFPKKVLKVYGVGVEIYDIKYGIEVLNKYLERNRRQSDLRRFIDELKLDFSCN